MAGSLSLCTLTLQKLINIIVWKSLSILTCMQECRKQLKIGGAEYIIETDLYGEKLQSYGVTEKVGEAAAYPDPPVPTPMNTEPAMHGCTGMHYCNFSL